MVRTNKSNYPYFEETEGLKKVPAKLIIEKPYPFKPHVVILGAGASVAAFPSGDANGKNLPTMDNLIDIVGIKDYLTSQSIRNYEKNFEDFYSNLYNNDPNSRILIDVESIVFKYFSELKIPDIPTIYDYLLLSLRSKDVIATFNWDPFLYDASKRIAKFANIPQIIHLHGNVRIKYCVNHLSSVGNFSNCKICGKELIPTKLLYPITKKNYQSDVFIKNQWEIISYYLENAFTVTIFGYGAPKTDIEAFNLLKQAWMNKSERQLEHFQIIDIKDKEALTEQWKVFTPSFHFHHFNDFFESFIAKHPRRSCEALYIPSMLGKYIEDFPIVQGDFNTLTAWSEPFLEYEEKYLK